MKKLSALILALLLMMLAGCGAKTDKSADLDAVKNSLAAQYDLSDMMELDENDLMELYGIDQADVKQFVALIAKTSLSSDEIVLIEATGSEAASRVQEKLSNRFQSKLNESKDYLPDEYAKISACSVDAAGCYVSMIVSGDAAAMTEIYKSAFK